MTKQFMHTRRALLKRTALALGVASLSPNLLAALSFDTQGTKSASILQANQLNLVAQLAELIIPQTDTAGALQAGVPACIDHLVASVFGHVHQSRFIKGLDTLLQTLATRFNTTITQAQPPVLVTFIDWLEQHTFIDKQADAIADAYRELKELVVFSYYTSEVGATKELHYQAVPGKYISCAPLEQIGKTWATANPY